MGGLGLKATRLTPADCVALCGPCNARAESDLQGEALRYGWKVKNFSPVPCTDIPYYDKLSGNWWLADKYGDRRWADPQWSVEQVAHALGA